MAEGLLFTTCVEADVFEKMLREEKGEVSLFPMDDPLRNAVPGDTAVVYARGSARHRRFTVQKVFAGVATTELGMPDGARVALEKYVRRRLRPSKA